jgi:hypothetical protein
VCTEEHSVCENHASTRDANVVLSFCFCFSMIPTHIVPTEEEEDQKKKQPTKTYQNTREIFNV